jgi:ABC-type multidrug transport system ATPase subunit
MLFDRRQRGFLQWRRIPARNEGRQIEHPAIVTPPILQADRLCFDYPQRKLFDGLTVHIPPGVSLVRGGDGCGKTTLLRLLAGELPAAGGELQLNGIRLDNQPAAYRQQVFWIDPRSEAFDQMTPVDYFRSVQQIYPLFDQSLLGDLIAGFSLAPHLGKHLYMLSTGSKRKVWLAAAFASGAALTLLDDPFAALDKPSAGFVMELLEEAAGHPARAWVVGHYEVLGGVPLATMIDLGD